MNAFDTSNHNSFPKARVDLTILKWKRGDAISVAVDMKFSWTISFSINHQMLGKPLKIMKNDVYFPAIQLIREKGHVYEVVD